MAHTLYRMFDRDGVLLYVGISKRPMTRFDEHGRAKSWWQDVDRITVEHFPSRLEVAEAERYAIQNEGPRHNIVHARIVAASSRDAKRLARIKDEAEMLADILGMGLAATWGLINAGRLDEAEDRMHRLRTGILRDVCPACGGRSIYVPADDRYYHADGTANASCWRAIMHGESGR